MSSGPTEFKPDKTWAPDGVCVGLDVLTAFVHGSIRIQPITIDPQRVDQNRAMEMAARAGGCNYIIVRRADPS